MGGNQKSVEYKRQKLCDHCNGDGGPKEARLECEACGGVGRTAAFTFMGLSAFDAVCLARSKYQISLIRLILFRYVPHAMDVDSPSRRRCAVNNVLEAGLWSSK